MSDNPYAQFVTEDANPYAQFVSDATTTTTTPPKQDYQRQPYGNVDISSVPAQYQAGFQDILNAKPLTEEQIRQAQNTYAADARAKARVLDLRNMALEGGGMMLGAGVAGLPGAAAGFAAGRQAIYALDQNRLPTATDETVRAIKDVGKGALYDIGGRLIMSAPGVVSRAWQNTVSPQIRASNLLRAVVGNDPAAIANIQAANVRQPNMLASQAAANVPNISGYQTLVREAEQTDPLEFAAKTRSATAKRHQDTLDILAGGADETTRLATNLIDKSNLTTATAPIRKEALTGAQEAVVKAGEQKALKLDEAVRQNPLNADKITSAIDAKLSNPEYGMNSDLRTALTKVKSMLSNWVNTNGIITPEALYAARKNGITSVIESMEGLSTTAKQKLASKVLNDLKPVLDDAITEAGGKNWAKYLEEYTAGSRKIDEKQLFGQLSDMYKKNPQQFVDAVKGNNPELIQNIFGYGEYDIQKVLGDKYSAILKMANNAERELAITDAAGQGGKRVSSALEDTSMLNKLTSLLGGKVELANKLVEGLKGNVSKSTMDAITAASRSGASMNDLLATMPYNQQQEFIKAFRNSKFAGTGLNVLSNQLQGQQ